MPIAVLLPLIIQYGLPFAEKMFQLAQRGGDVTAEDFASLRQMANQMAQDRVKAQLVAKGIPLDSEQATMLLKLAE